MKALLRALCAGSVLVLSGVAHAEVTSLKAKFKGGCLASNTTGNCTLGVTASGTDLGSDGVQLWHADAPNGTYTLVSKRVKSLSSAGTATYRFANKAGCYKVRTKENGNDQADVTSRAVCEK